LRNALEATRQEMGGVLKLTSFSPNIKERMDAPAPSSTPRPARRPGRARAGAPGLDAEGRRAHHRHGRAAGPGDVVIVNDPFVGGAHLPDITLIAPRMSATP
jgi:N-methylhydantoinase B